MRLFPFLLHRTCSAVVLCTLIPLQLPAFTVVKNVNDGHTPVEAVVIFDKAQPHNHLVIEDKVGQTGITFREDGALEVYITGNHPIQPTITWKATEKLKETFNAADYAYLVIRMAMAGDVKRTFPNGRTSSSRPGNLWFPIALYDADGRRSGQANPANLTEDKRTPAEVVTLHIPMMLFLNGAIGDTTRIRSIGFPWGQTHDYNNRDIRLLVEHIGLAN